MRVYRASSLGYSLEALVAPHLGYTPVAPPDYLQAAFDEGNRIEPLCIQKLRDMGWVIQDKQDELNAVGDYQIEVELEVIPGRAKIVGHLDGRISYGCGVPAILEVKSMAHKGFTAWKRHGWDAPGLIQKYKWQASALMLAEQMPHCLVAWDKETEELSWMTVTEPFYTLSDIALKIGEAEKHIEAGTLPDGCTDFPCFFHYLHPPSDNPIQPADEELDDLMAKWLSLDNFEKAYKKEKDGVREQMLAITGVEGVANVRGCNGVTVTTTWQEGGSYTAARKSGWVTKVSGPRKGNRGE